jgi:hypothetical protein
MTSRASDVRGDRERVLAMGEPSTGVSGWIGLEIVPSLCCAPQVDGGNRRFLAHRVGQDHGGAAMEEVKDPVLDVPGPPAKLVDPVLQVISVWSSEPVSLFRQELESLACLDPDSLRVPGQVFQDRAFTVGFLVEEDLLRPHGVIPVLR